MTGNGKHTTYKGGEIGGLFIAVLTNIIGEIMNGESYANP